MFDIKPSEASAWFNITRGDFTKTRAFKEKVVLLLKGTLTKNQENWKEEQEHLQRLTDEGQLPPVQFPQRDLPMEQERVQDNSMFGGPRE